ncbi:MAG: Tol-Pal system beta propeller repeat protein TolB [Deltaproteobacteria bacterium]|nr:Tol-Pal system beta propeller repeat protein TolB [Deltaproteobacteria bacterium]
MKSRKSNSVDWPGGPLAAAHGADRLRGLVVLARSSGKVLGALGAVATMLALAAVLASPLPAAAQPGPRPVVTPAPPGAATVGRGSTGGGALSPQEEVILEGEVVNPLRQAYPLAVPDVRGEGEAKVLAEEASRVLRKDLEISGFFKLIPPSTFFFDYAKEGLSASSIAFQHWLATGAQGLIKGVVTTSGERAQVELRLYQVDRGMEVDLGLPPRQVAPQSLHREVHRFVNAVIKFFTGREGIFGSQIAFVTSTGKGSKVVGLVDLDGTHQVIVSRSNTLNLLPAWAPGGSALLYTTYANGNPDLVSHPLGSKSPTFLSQHSGLNVGGAYSPRGNIVALTLSKDGNSEIYLISAKDGSVIQRLTDNWATDTSPCWSPDGSRIAFVSDRAGSPQIYVMNADGSDVKRLTFRGNYNTTPDWSPKGDKIAFTARDERYVFDIFTVQVDTGDIERLTQDAGHNEEPSHSPDGNYIVFTSTRDGGSKLYVMTADGMHQTVLTEKGSGYFTPAWGPAPSFQEER